MTNGTPMENNQPDPTPPTLEELFDQLGSKKEIFKEILGRVHRQLADDMGDELAALKTRNRALENQVAHLEQKVQGDTVSLAHALKNIVTSGTPKDKLDASPPSAFEGKPEEVEPFLAAARLYHSLKPNAFSSEKQRMLWLLSYFTSSQSEPWARAEVKSIEAGTNSYKTYSGLEELIKASFSSISRKEEARHKLKAMKLGQKEGLGTFVNRFRPEAEAADFGEEATAYFFSAALSQELVLQLTTLNQGTVPTTPAEWYKVSLTYDHAKALAQNLVPSSTFRSNLSNTSSRPPATSSSTTPNASASAPAPMGLDGHRPKYTRRPLTCYRCGEEGHKQADCTNPEKKYLRAGESLDINSLADSFSKSFAKAMDDALERHAKKGGFQPSQQ